MEYNLLAVKVIEKERDRQTETEREKEREGGGERTNICYPQSLLFFATFVYIEKVITFGCRMF
jgi:hypothetical protein